MGIHAGLVGLPNVGKSTLFNALTQSKVPAENYPFCTIEPHKAMALVPDARMDMLQKLYGSEKQIPATVSFVDIAGLVKGAASGEGLGNQFLSHIREVDLILHIVRCFEDENITHTSGIVDPLADFEIIIAELMLKDLESVQKRLEKIPKSIKQANDAKEKQELTQEQALLERLLIELNKGDVQRVRACMTAESNANITIPLLSTKRFLVIANLAEDEIGNPESNAHFKKLVSHFGAKTVIPISAKIENELAQLSPSDAADIMGLLGLKERGLSAIVRSTYEHLGLITFFTCGPKEIHAWPIRSGTNIRVAAGEIHSDLQRGFICAEVFNCKELFALGSIAKVKESGKIRTEGADYMIQDGDIVLVKFNV